jgi:hypothetical protein
VFCVASPDSTNHPQVALLLPTRCGTQNGSGDCPGRSQVLPGLKTRAKLLALNLHKPQSPSAAIGHQCHNSRTTRDSAAFECGSRLKSNLGVTSLPKALYSASCKRSDRARELRSSEPLLEHVPRLRSDVGKRMPFPCTHPRFQVHLVHMKLRSSFLYRRKTRLAHELLQILDSRITG